jgi:hypothetical protein
MLLFLFFRIHVANPKDLIVDSKWFYRLKIRRNLPEIALDLLVNVHQEGDINSYRKFGEREVAQGHVREFQVSILHLRIWVWSILPRENFSGVGSCCLKTQATFFVWHCFRRPSLYTILRSRALLEKATVTRPVKKSPCLYGARSALPCAQEPITGLS